MFPPCFANATAREKVREREHPNSSIVPVTTALAERCGYPKPGQFGY
jgi:hypothetical protein